VESLYVLLFSSTYISIDGGPFTSFSETFYVSQAHLWALLEIEVLTGYDAFASSANVLVNNTKIGVIDPRPLSRYQDVQAYSILFSTGVFNGLAPYTGSNILRIQPVAQADWVVVRNWWIHYYSL
jgi:hypothetical protein